MSETEALRRINDALKLGKTDLEITHLKLERLPEALFELLDLETFIVHNNRLAALPDELWRLTQLKKMFLEFNQLTALPAEIATLPNLRVLSVSGNRLTALPEALFDTQIEELYLSSNSLRTLPADIGRLKTLKKLYVGEAQMRSLPPELGDLPDLKAIHAPNNHLIALPPELEKLTNLQVLNVSGNRLTTVSPKIAALPGLRTLNLSKNPLPEGVLEAARKSPSACLEELERFILPGFRLTVSGDVPLHELRAYLSEVEHAFNSYLVFERVIIDVSKQLKETQGTDAPVPLPSWPITREVVAARVRDPKRLFVRNVRWGLTGSVELATRSTRTAALGHLVSTINKAAGKPADRRAEKALAKKSATLKKAGIPKDQIHRLTSDLIDSPARAILAFVRGGIIKDAELV